MSDYLTVSQAAARLGISERTIQRRCKNGQLSARLETTPDGAQWLIDPATLPTGAATTADKVPTANQVQKAPLAATGADTNDTTAATLPTGAAIELLAEKDARIADLRAQVDAWRLQAEAANRTASETAAALREALKAMPKALPDGGKLEQVGTENQTRENAPQAPKSATGDQTPAASTPLARRGAQARKLTAWQRVAGRILGIR